MKRLLFTAAAFVSLVLCVVVVALWIRSYRATQQYSYYKGTWTRSFGAAKGRLYYMASCAPPGPGSLGWHQYPAFQLRYRQPLAGEPGVRHHGTVLGVFWYITDGGTSTRTPSVAGMPSGGQIFIRSFTPNFEIFIPFWIGTVALALLPAVWIVTRIKKRYANDGTHCTTCGYDLTGNTAGICPECGKPIKRQAT